MTSKLRLHITQAIVLLASATCLYLITSIFSGVTAKSGARLEDLWQEDIKTLTQKKALPLAWTKISQVEKIAAQDDLVAEIWLKTVSTPIQVNAQGEYKLEILFLSDRENGHETAVIQHHLVHIPTGNSVWELGRTYRLD